MNVFEMKCLRSLVVVSRMDRVMRAGRQRELASRADQSVLRWFGHVERMDDYRMDRRVFMVEVSEGGYEVDRSWLDLWCKGGLGQQRNDGGSDVTEISERLESYVVISTFTKIIEIHPCVMNDHVIN